MHSRSKYSYQEPCSSSNLSLLRVTTGTIYFMIKKKKKKSASSLVWSLFLLLLNLPLGRAAGLQPVDVSARHAEPQIGDDGRERHGDVERSVAVDALTTAASVRQSVHSLSLSLVHWLTKTTRDGRLFALRYTTAHHAVHLVQLHVSDIGGERL